MYQGTTVKIVAGGISSLILTMGIARFTYTPALPKMQQALGLSDDTAGLLAAFNFAGYLSGALLASRLGSDPHIKRRLFRFGLILAVLCNALLPAMESLTYWSLMRYLSGLSSAAGMVLGTSLVLEYLARHADRQLIGMHFGGVGVGIVITALALGGTAGPGWQATWWLSALLGALFLLPAWLWVGATIEEAPATPVSTVRVQTPGRPFQYLSASYFFAGGSFAVGTTFLLAVIETNPQLIAVSQSAWLLLGLAAAPSCFLWVRWAHRFGTLQSLLTAWTLQTIGLALPLFGTPGTTLIGGLLFGFTFMGIVAMVLGQAGQMAPDNPARLMGILVTTYGVGQIAGPILAGQVMAHSGVPESALWLAASLSLAGTLLAIGSTESRTRDAHCPQTG